MSSTITRKERFSQDEWAWISGASSGLGRALSLRLAGEGVGVVLTSRRTEQLSALAEEIISGGGHAIPLGCDLTDTDAIGAAVKTISDRVGRLDIVVPAAGQELLLPFEMCSPKKWHQVMDVNVVGAFEMVRAAIPLLKASGAREQGQGRVVLVSSSAALAGSAGNLCYSASKAAVLAGMKCLAVELAPLKIRVNAVVPGLVRTPMQERMFARLNERGREDLERGHPLGLGSPEDVVAAIVFLASYEASWATGTGMVIDGGTSAASSSYRRG